MNCKKCACEIPDDLLACPACKSLCYTDELRNFNVEVQAHVLAGRYVEARDIYVKMLGLIPADSRQSLQIADKLEEIEQILALRAAEVTSSKSSKGKYLLNTAGLILVLWLLFGLNTGAGVLVLIIIHEYGHVLAASGLGYACSNPAFAPLFGAYVTLKSKPLKQVHDVLIYAGGPVAGMLASAGVLIYARSAQSTSAGLIAYYGFALSLWNLLPFPGLDGSGMLSGLTRMQWCAAGVSVWLGRIYCEEKILTIIFAFFVIRVFIALGKSGPEAVPVERGDFELTPGQRWASLGLYLALLFTLCWFLQLSSMFHTG